MRRDNLVPPLLMGIVGLSLYVRRWIGYRLWRAIHYLSFGVFLLALIHGLLSGTDSASVWARDLYWTSGVTLTGLTLYRATMPRRALPAG